MMHLYMEEPTVDDKLAEEIEAALEEISKVTDPTWDEACRV